MRKGLCMKKCPNCGVRNDGDSLFCMACGSLLVPTVNKRESKNKCSNCGADLGKGELFCPEGGTKRSKRSAKPKKKKSLAARAALYNSGTAGGDVCVSFLCVAGVESNA